MKDNKMKCPFCGIEMKRIVQPYPAKYNKPDLVLYDHPSVNTCKHGSSYDKVLGYAGHTLTAESWMKRYKDINS